MLEVVIDPLRLEAYNVTAGELIGVVQNNNQLIAAGEVETAQGAFAVKIPSSFDEPRDVYDLPVKVNGDRVVTLGDLAEIRLTFEDRAGHRALQRRDDRRAAGGQAQGLQPHRHRRPGPRDGRGRGETWPRRSCRRMRSAPRTTSRQVASMVSQLEGSVLTAIALVMIVVLAALGIALGAAGGLCDPDLVPAVFRASWR
jgi:multidrug efflux pump